MRNVTLVILNSLRIKCHIRRPLNREILLHKLNHYGIKGTANMLFFVVI